MRALLALVVCISVATTARPASAPPPLTLNVVGGVPTAVFERPADPDRAFVLEASSDLLIWTPVWASHGADNLAGPVSLADPYPLPPGPSRRFRRLSVRDTPPSVPVFGLRPVIVIKLDDVKPSPSGWLSEKWFNLSAYAAERRIKMGLGVICRDLLETPQTRTLNWLHATRDDGWIEFWLHAYDHTTHTGGDGVVYSEFVGRPREELKRRIDLCQSLAVARLGAPFRVFGPPGGGSTAHVNSDLLDVLYEDPHLRGILYPTPQDALGAALQARGEVMVMDRVWPVNIEQPLFVPNLATFITQYRFYAPSRRYFVLQGHPANWDDARFAEFGRILDFLVSENAVFLHPSELAALLAAHGP